MIENSNVGRIIADHPPAPGNPRNSEGSFLTLNDGSILFVYTRFEGGDAGDYAPADIYAMTSEDEGETWSEPEPLLNRTLDNAQNVMSVSLLRMNNGDVGVFYFLRTNTSEGRPYMRRSSDEGKTWSDPVSCTNTRGVYVKNNDRVIKTSTGRIVVPAAYHRTIVSPDGSEHWDSYAVTYFFFSDDDGKTFQQSEPCYLQASRGSTGLQEPGVIELKNGTLYGWARTDVGTQYEMFSKDGGDNWSTPQPSHFMSPNSPMSMKRLPDGDTLMAIWNPIPNYPGRVKDQGGFFGGRTPLVYALSEDEGKSWTRPVIIEDDPLSGYCYTAIHFTKDNQMLLAYCAGGQEDRSTLVRLRMRKMPVPTMAVVQAVK